MIADVVRIESVQIGDRVVISGKIRPVERKYLSHGSIRIEYGNVGNGDFWGTWCHPGDLIPVIRKATPND